MTPIDFHIFQVLELLGHSSPISLFVATLVMFLWRPIMEELASALPISGAPYTYLSVGVFCVGLRQTLTRVTQAECSIEADSFGRSCFVTP